MWIAYAFGSAFFAGITAVLAKAGVEDTDSHLVTALRMLVIVPFSWLMAFLTGSGETEGTLPAGSLIFLVLSGMTTGASWLCYFKALSLGDVNKVVPIDKSSVILTMVLAFVFLGEPIGWLKVLCMILIGVGTLLMIEQKETDKKEEERAWLVYAVLSAVFASATSILGKVGIHDVESNLGTAIRNMVVLVMAWLFVFYLGKQKEIRHISKKSALFIVLSGISTGCSWLCYYRALQAGPASVVVPVDKLSIVVSVVFAYAFFREKLSAKGLFGLVIIVMGTLLLLV